MSDLTKFSDGASILQQVDVSDIFKNLALGIAEAQQKLDDNSIAQAIKLAETNIDGESLLALGFAPVFYAFQYADISASINLRMGLKEAVEFGFGIDIQLSNKKGYSQSNREFLSSNNYSETSEEYKTTRQVNFRAKEKKAIKINNKFVSQSESLQSKSRLENLKHKIKSETSVDQVYDEILSRKLTNNQSRGVDVWMDGGFLRIEEGLHFGASGVGVLKIKDYSIDKTIDIDGPDSTSSFDLTNNLKESLESAELASGVIPGSLADQLYGLSKEGVLYTHDGTNWKPISSKFYFPYNSDEITYGQNLKLSTETSVLDYSSPYEAPASAVNNENYAEHRLIHKVLRMIRSHDSDASITITGMTDPKGGDNPKNKSLAKRRAEKLRDHIFGSDAPVNVEIGAVTNAAGNSNLLQRNAEIKLDSDYMIFIGGNVKAEATPEKASGLKNIFVYADDSDTTAFHTLNVQYGSLGLLFTNASFTTLVEEAQLQITDHSHELTSEGLHYSLDNEAIVKLHLLSSQSEEIAIEENEESSSEGTENQSTYLWAKSKNENSALSDTLTNNSQDKSFAFGASVDFRMSRQFEMSMEGNSAMSARLVALPAPERFREFLEEKYGNPTTEQ